MGTQPEAQVVRYRYRSRLLHGEHPDEVPEIQGLIGASGIAPEKLENIILEQSPSTNGLGQVPAAPSSSANACVCRRQSPGQWSASPVPLGSAVQQGSLPNSRRRPGRSSSLISLLW